MRRLIAALLIVTCPLPAMASAILGVSIEQGAGGVERLRFSTDQAVTPTKLFTLPAPDRVVIDIPTAKTNAAVLPASYPTSLVKNVRFGQFDMATTRIVIDMKSPAKIVGSLTMPPAGTQGAQLLVDLAPSGAVAPASTSATAPSAEAAAAAPFGAGTPLSPVVPQQEKPLIVIDAGHGGSDPGAIGVNGTFEKALTLAMAKELRRTLEASGRYRVTLTRDDDVFIPLRERIRLAREANGHLFISLHADALAHGMARGASVYTLSETASDAEAALLASKENKAEIIIGADLRNHDPIVTSILIDLAQRDTNNKSIEFADLLSAELAKVTPLLRKHRRFAGFAVLKSPDMPSVLVELGYISNSDDAANLDDAAFRAKLAQAALSAVDRYFADIKS